MNTDNDDLEYILNYYKINNNKEKIVIFEDIKKEYKVLHKLKLFVNNTTDIELVDLNLNIINDKIEKENNKIKNEENRINNEKIETNEEKLSFLKDKLQKFECANDVLDNLIKTGEGLINKSEKLLSKDIETDDEEKLVEQIKKNDKLSNLITLEIETISNTNNLEKETMPNELEKELDDIGYEINNLIKEKQLNNKKPPIKISHSLYEDFKKQREYDITHNKEIKHEDNTIQNLKKKNNIDVDIEYNRKLNEYRKSINPHTIYNEYIPPLNPHTIHNEYRPPPLNPRPPLNTEPIYNEYKGPSNYYNEYRQSLNQQSSLYNDTNHRLDALRKLYGINKPNNNYRNPSDIYRRTYESNREPVSLYRTYLDDIREKNEINNLSQYDNKYDSYLNKRNEYLNQPQDKIDINREIILIENRDSDNIIKNMFNKLKNNKKDIETIIYEKEEKIFYEKLEKKQQDKIDKIEQKILKLNNINVPLRFRILKSQLSLHTKSMIINKFNDLTSNKFLGGSEISKYTNWVNSLLKVPFKKYRKLPLDTTTSNKSNIGNYLINVRKTLDDAVFGHINTKEQITQIIAQWISNPTSVGNCIGIQGVMGNGKTTLVKNGISKAIDRPFAFITLGGCSDSSYLDGHNYTYEGSTWGKIVDVLIECKCMNPVFYFDELDKVSDTPKGDEIINTLIHLTDASQNNEYNDKYFNGVSFDLSKALFIFSFNDKKKINPILLDRLVCIETEKFTTEDKIQITNNYLLNDIYSQLDIKKDKYKLTDKLIEYIITTYTEDEGGVRSLKKNLFNIFSKLNLLNLTKHNKDIKYSFDLDNNILESNEITKDIIDKFIKDNNNNEDDLYYKNWYA